MPQLTIYPSGTQLPDHFYYQAQAFSRIVWYDGDDYDIDRERHEPMTHFVLANGKALISYAQVLWHAIDHAGTVYRCGGLSGVMTFPFFRRRGYGGQVVAAATALIRADESADMALLWTARANEGFYRRYGWEAMPNMTTLIGDKRQPDVFDDELALMLFLSAKGKRERPNIANGRVYVGAEQW